MDVPREQLMRLIELAEELLWVQYSEYSNHPTDGDRELMLSLWRLVGKEVPSFFARKFDWKIESEVETDGEDNAGRT